MMGDLNPSMARVNLFDGDWIDHGLTIRNTKNLGILMGITAIMGAPDKSGQAFGLCFRKKRSQ